jgi:hypothetical protein
MGVIWKFTISPWRTTIPVPDGAQVLSCGFQGELLQVWLRVDPSKPPRNRAFYVICTGQEFGPDVGKFVGTVHHPNGLVFHVFDDGYTTPVSSDNGNSEAK